MLQSKYKIHHHSFRRVGKLLKLKMQMHIPILEIRVEPHLQSTIDPQYPERFIQIYYNPDRILDISITSANIRSLPAVKFKNATRIEFSYNQLREFPDINFIAPDIDELLLRRNPFYLSEFENERKLQNTGYTSGATTGTVLDKIPTNLKRLYLEGTFMVLLLKI